MRILLWMLTLLAVGCGHMAKVRPTPKGQLELEETLGGPIGYVAQIPVPTPLSTVGASYGVAERADISAHLHPTAAAFGVAGLDVGGSALLFEQRGALPALTLASRLYGFSDFRTGSRAYLELGATLSHRFGPRFITYLGGNAFLQTRGPPLWSLASGAELLVGPVAVQAEVRWYEPDLPTERTVVKWLGVAGQGGVGVLIGWRVRFGEGAW